MNRRSFFSKLGLAAASLAVLPAATTYARKWIKPTVVNPMWIPSSEWETATYETSWYCQTDYGFLKKNFVTPIIYLREKEIHDGKGSPLPILRYAINEDEKFDQVMPFTIHSQ